MATYGMQVAGWVGIWVAAVAFYDATAILTAEVYDHVSAVIPCAAIPCAPEHAPTLLDIASVGACRSGCLLATSRGHRRLLRALLAQPQWLRRSAPLPVSLVLLAVLHPCVLFQSIV